jgi:hypothetical protein
MKLLHAFDMIPTFYGLNWLQFLSSYFGDKYTHISPHPMKPAFYPNALPASMITHCTDHSVQQYQHVSLSHINFWS